MTITTALTLLEGYESQQNESHEVFKKALWNVTKARYHQAGNGTSSLDATLLATSVREELLKATFRVDVEPELVEEDNVDTTVDAVTDASADVPSTTSSSETLRNRKNKKAEGATKSEWTTEEEKNPSNEFDPLELFGTLNRRELKQAQAYARKALEMYIESAKLARQIQNALKK